MKNLGIAQDEQTAGEAMYLAAKNGVRLRAVRAEAVAVHRERARESADAGLAAVLTSRAVSEPDSDVRFELVASLRAAIAAGTYHVDAADVATSMMGGL